jgi:hypothetical protein
MAIEIERIESDHHDLGRSALQLVLQHGKIGRSICCGCHDFTIDDRRTAADMPSIVGDLLEALVQSLPRRVNAVTAASLM